MTSRILLALLVIFSCQSAVAQSEAESLSARFRKAARRVLPAVVTVRVTLPPRPQDTVFSQALETPGGAGRRESGGSGVIIDAARGFILTNHHVIDGAARVVVILHGGKERAVKEIRRDPKSDLALLAVDPAGLQQAEWGDSDTLDLGDWVLAIGQPFGLSDTVTAGIVSGKGRGVGLALYEDLIQTDAAINPGNSGGPLVNMKGEVVGISTALKSAGGGFEGVGFAVPASRARRVADDLAKFGVVKRAFIGVNVQPVAPEVLDRLDQPGAVVVSAVAPGSPAAEAGLRPGDLLLKVDGKTVTGAGPLQAIVEVSQTGKPLVVGIERAGKRVDVKVTPRVQPERFGLPETRTPPPPRE